MRPPLFNIKLILTLIAASFVSLIAASQAHALELQKVRFGLHSDKVRAVIELNEQTEFRSFMLPKTNDKSYRLVVDLPNFDWKAGEIARPPKINVTDVRSGTLNSKTKRVVIDLTKPAVLKNAFMLPADRNQPYRLVLDFSHISESAFQTTERKIFGLLDEQPEKQNTLTNLINKQLNNPINQTKTSKSGIIIPPRKPISARAAVVKPASTFAQTPLRKPLIVIDAGHGGADPGAIGAGKAYEKHVTLSAAKILKRELEETGRYRVHLTRDSDKYLKLYQRRAIARNKKADLFISLHADSIDKENVRGASIYTLSNKSSDAQTAKLAARENQVDLIAGVDLSHEDKDVANILIDLAMRDTMNQSKFFANTVVEQMQKSNIRVLPKPHRYAGFAVLKSPDVPSVLVEMGFMSNISESKLLRTTSYQEKIAQSLLKSIDSYFKKVRKNSLQ